MDILDLFKTQGSLCYSLVQQHFHSVSFMYSPEVILTKFQDGKPSTNLRSAITNNYSGGHRGGGHF